MISSDVRTRMGAPAAVFSPLAALFGVVLLAGCGGGGDGDDGSGAPAAAATLFVATESGAIDTVDQNLQTLATFLSTGNRVMAVDGAGNVFHAGDLAGVPSVTAISALRRRASGTMTSPSRDRTFGGMDMVAPRGVAIDHVRGRLYVADAMASVIHVRASGSAGAASFGTIAVPVPARGVAIDQVRQRLYAALSDGRISVFSLGTFITPLTMITPSDGTVQITEDLHGIAYDPVGDRLVVTDVHATDLADGAGFASDGAIYVIAAASSASGMTIPTRIVSGASTMLGNPVACALANGDLYVAEHENDLVLAFRDVFAGASGDVAPDSIAEKTKPTGIARALPLGLLQPDVTDVDVATPLAAIGTVQNPGSTLGQGVLLRIEPELDGVIFPVTLGFVLKDAVYDAVGDAYVTHESNLVDPAGVIVLSRAAGPHGHIFSEDSDRMIGGTATGLVAPKGIEISNRHGLIFVADDDATAPAVRVFGTQAAGDVPPAFVAGLTGIGRPWDLDYDPAADRLFVALTDGRVAVYDAFVATSGAGGPSRLIVPTDGVAQISVDLRGIVHVAAQDRLILADAGVVGDADDGQILSITGASGASGMTAVATRIAGASTLLGDPVDLAFDGANLLVAEKANAQILRFDAVAGLTGDVAPSIAFLMDAPESIVPVPTRLAEAPSGF